MGKHDPALGQNIRRLREGGPKKITRDKMGEDLGVTGTTIYRWENALAWPEPETLPEIAKYLGVTTGELLGEPNIPPSPIPPDQMKAITQAVREAHIQMRVSDQSAPYFTGPLGKIVELLKDKDESFLNGVLETLELMLGLDTTSVGNRKKKDVG